MLCAHINPSTDDAQSVKEHLYSVAELAKEFSAKISLAATGELMGILHDMGKGTGKFDAYIRYSAKNPNDKSLKGQRLCPEGSGNLSARGVYRRLEDPLQPALCLKPCQIV
jgi:hypothetical protein